jgi:iron(III) transport system substrate-binding protein
MRTRRAPGRIVATSLAALALVMASCGGDDSGSADNVDDTEAATTAAPATTAAATTAAETTVAGDSTATTAAGGATTTAAGGAATTVAGSGAGPVAATEAEWEEIVAAAQEEGSVTIYSSQGLDQLNALGEAFEEEYGISVEVVRAIDSDQLAKVEAEHDTGNGIADVLAQATGAWSVEKAAAGWFTPFVGPAMDNPNYSKALNVSAGGEYFVSSGAVLTFGWNTELWPDGLTDYDDLLNPELAGGKIGVIEPAAGSIVDFWLYLEERFGPEFTAQLAAQEPRIYPSSLPMAQALTSGEIAAASFVQVLTDEKEAGAPVDSGLADEVWGALFQTSVLATAPHPNAAQVLANFMITPEGQAHIARKAAAALPDIEGTVTVTDNVRRQDLAKLTPDFVAEYQATWDQLFNG